MKPFTSLIRAALLTTAIAGVVGAANAADLPVGGPQHARPVCADMEARLAGRLAYAEVELNLTEAQKADFKRLAEVMKTAGEPSRKACEQMSGQPRPTSLPERLETMRKMATLHSEALAKVTPEVARFYKELTPEQQKVADETLMSHHGGHHHRWGHGDASSDDTHGKMMGQ